MSEDDAGRLIAHIEQRFGVKAAKFQPLQPLSNGVLLDFYQNLVVISLVDVQREWRRGSFLKIRKGDRCLIRQCVPGQLTLGKATASWNFRDMKENVQEGVDFTVIAGEVPYPPKQTPEEIKESQDVFNDLFGLFS